MQSETRSSSLLSINNSEIEENKNNEIKKLEFSTFTSAVCEDKKDVVYCKDEVFVNCNGKISLANDVQECNGFKIEKSKVNGFAVFENNWKDPRN